MSSSASAFENKPVQTNNFLQLAWNNPEAIEALDVLMNIFHLGSPTFLKQDDANETGSLGMAIWIHPLMNIMKDSKPNDSFKRIEIHSRSQCKGSFLYFTLNAKKWLNENEWIPKFEKLQQQSFPNLWLNWMEQQVTIIASSVCEGIALSALIQDFLRDKTPIEQISSIWEKMSNDIQAENNNLLSLSQSQKYLKPEKFLKFLPLTFHFYNRLLLPLSISTL